jgi:hypothetical protein
MNPEDFKKRIIMPPEQPMQEEVQPEQPEHPNTGILENTMLNQHEKMSETNQLLEHLLVKLDSNSDKSIEEHTLVKIADVVDELKSLKEVIKDNNQWEVNLILE